MLLMLSALPQKTLALQNPKGCPAATLKYGCSTASFIWASLVEMQLSAKPSAMHRVANSLTLAWLVSGKTTSLCAVIGSVIEFEWLVGRTFLAVGKQAAATQGPPRPSYVIKRTLCPPCNGSVGEDGIFSCVLHGLSRLHATYA